MNKDTVQNMNTGVDKGNNTLNNQKNNFEQIIKDYLDSNPLLNNKTKELEVRFGTNPKVSRPISKIDYDNVIKHLYACGFNPETEEGIQMLRIQNEFIDPKTGVKKMSNIRAEINGIDLIQEYCKTNSLQKLIDMPSTTYNKLKFTQKMSAKRSNDEIIKKVEMEDYNFRVSFQNENDIQLQSNLGRKIIDKWNDSLKLFRLMNRVRFYHSDYPVYVDLTVVKNSSKINKVPVPKYTIQEAEVMNNIENYEIELEMDNLKVGPGSDFNSVNSILNALRKCIRIVLSGIQRTKFPISYKEQDFILQSYMRLIQGDEYKENQRINSNNFIGPSSYTLQMENLIDNENLDLTSPNIRNNYTVTDKADGERNLLYINETGKIYLIDTNMSILYTGTQTFEKTIFNSLLDGELIKHNKLGEYINLFAAFDVYFINEKSVRDLPFILYNAEDSETKYRLPLLYKFVDLIQPISILENIGSGEVKPKKNTKPCHFRIECKAFYYNIENKTIFDGCSKILSNIKDGIFEYNTDGLIFTPALLAVGANNINDKACSLQKTTWDYSFKWKPAEFNTIDFLVSVKKNKMGKDEIHHIFEDGTNLERSKTIQQYKTLILRCGFSEKKHGFLNPYQDVLDDTNVNITDIDNENTYKPVPFQPTNPRDPNAYLCNILLNENNSNLIMKTEEGEVFDENMIVEFKYELDNKEGWKWVPLRVRYDKTAEFLSKTKKNYGNAYHVANSNWHSIHNPITENMISTGNDIPYNIDEIYYNRNANETNTQGLRNFHNLYVKSKLISSVSNRDDILIDYAVGKAGDLAKWIYSNLKFVFGIDVSSDNIHNQLDGACARFLKAKRKYNRMPSALFIKSDSGKNIRNKEDIDTSEKDKQIIDAVFGIGPKDATVLGKGVYKNFGIAQTGFNISSCQFAMHYFFKNIVSVNTFVRNLTECTKVNGYYIGTCYDGETVFNLLKNKNKNESVTIFKNNHKIFELTKQYDQTGFPDDDLSLGYGIDVYQESINKEFKEYLVNFKYFTQLMEDYGFILITTEEARQMSLPNNTGLFKDMFDSMELDIKQNHKRKQEYKQAVYMSPEEKQISFMNRYFVFKKVRNVDAKKMFDILIKQTDIINKMGEDNIENNEKIVDVDEKIVDEPAILPTQEKIKIIPKKTDRKVVLKKYN